MSLLTADGSRQCPSRALPRIRAISVPIVMPSIILEVVEQHTEEADFLWLLRDAAVLVVLGRVVHRLAQRPQGCRRGAQGDRRGRRPIQRAIREDGHAPTAAPRRQDLDRETDPRARPAPGCSDRRRRDGRSGDDPLADRPDEGTRARPGRRRVLQPDHRCPRRSPSTPCARRSRLATSASAPRPRSSWPSSNPGVPSSKSAHPAGASSICCDSDTAEQPPSLAIMYRKSVFAVTRVLSSLA